MSARLKGTPLHPNVAAVLVATAVACLAFMCAPAAPTTVSPSISPAAASGRGADPTAQTSVIGGKFAAQGTFPWMAFILDQRGEGGIACSGTVVAPNVVLTAAHCAVNLRTGETSPVGGYRVATGSVNWTSPLAQISDVSRIVVYPTYNAHVGPRGFGDAALLVLSTPTTAPSIPVATPADARRLRTGTHAFVAGWGLTRPDQKLPTESLVWARTVVEGTHCEGLFGRICALDFPKVTSGVCHGDSGGPLLAASPSGKGLVEIGITQAGFGACSTRRPGLFTRADLISAWLKRWVSSLSPPAPAKKS